MPKIAPQQPKNASFTNSWPFFSRVCVKVNIYICCYDLEQQTTIITNEAEDDTTSCGTDTGVLTGGG